MPPLKTYDLFISHAWKYNDEYYRLVDLLNAASNFKWRNYSVPEHDPVVDPNTETGKRKLRKELDEQIRPANCAVVISGMYVAHSDWIQAEIDIAQSYNKPIIGVRPRGQQVTPLAVSSAALEMVGCTKHLLRFHHYFVAISEPHCGYPLRPRNDFVPSCRPIQKPG